MEKFANILVYDCKNDVVGQTRSGRVIFRFNKNDLSFAVFRSHRMENDEKEFCLIMYRRLVFSSNDVEERSLRSALDYNLDQDVFCT